MDTEENAPSISVQQSILLLSDRQPDDLGKATLLPDDTTEGTVDLKFDSFRFVDNIGENPVPGQPGRGFLFIPPDPIGAAGLDRLVAVVNTMVEVRNKGGHLIARDGLRTFFDPLTPLTFTFDPKVVYDHYAARFVILTLEQVSGDETIDPDNISRILLAVSKDDSPNSLTTADWWFHAIDAKTVIAAPSPPRDRWADYPGFELDEEAVYITANMYSFVPFGLYGGVRLWIVDKGLGSGGFYDGGTAAVAQHDPYAGGGIVTTTMPALVFGDGGIGGPGSSIGTFLVSYSGLTDGVDEYVQVVSVDDPLGNSGGPTFVQEFVSIGNIENFPGGLADAPQLGSTIAIEVNDRRALDAVWRDGGLWLTSTIRPNTGPDMNQTTAHWWKCDTSGGPGAITLADQGDLGGEDIAPGTFTYFPAVAVNSLGDAMFGFSASAPTIYAGAYATGREAGDPAGTVQPSLTVKAGKDFYVRTFAAPRNRWGDYSGISVDPEEPDKFWVFNEFADTRGTPTGTPAGPEDGRWGTAWARVKFLTDADGAVVEVFAGTGADVLAQNEPNPFNPMTRIEYALPRDMHVSLRIFNVRGQQVQTLVDGFEPAGSHSVTWNGTDRSGVRVPSGAYVYRLEGDGIRATKRMIVLQ